MASSSEAPCVALYRQIRLQSTQRTSQLMLSASSKKEPIDWRRVGIVFAAYTAAYVAARELNPTEDWIDYIPNPVIAVSRAARTLLGRCMDAAGKLRGC